MNLFDKTEAELIDALYADWERNGPAAIERLRERDPAAYVRVMAVIAMPSEDGDSK